MKTKKKKIKYKIKIKIKQNSSLEFLDLKLFDKIKFKRRKAIIF